MLKKLAGLLLIASSVSVICIASFGAAQDVVETAEDRQLALARICASEEGLASPTDGCAAIYSVIANGAHRQKISWMRQARRGSPRSFNQRRGDSRRWIAFLTPDGTQPDGWPTHAWRRVTIEEDGSPPREMMQQVAHAAWSAPDRRDDFQRRWLRIYARAGRIVGGAEQHQCRLEGRREEAAYWGCPPDAGGQCRDHVRAQRAGWVQLDCGDTNNWFYCDPRMSRTCVRQPEEELLGG